ncbi:MULTISPECIES: ABC transporter ATP-binding protein [unclassified Campylobacter]|uniref:ABC transporter ATP-binding protein n=1 Tax=unclassified Campylobacter TaxID=2593542 RepID=UPI0022E9CD8B|nr:MULTISPECIES: ABC transporter ATP-binding protein [unclassified Campylobacter]MDA3079570.1 ABC transporter ATP-binding protein [Campylobacter sp. CS_NA2]MDA3080998.1 ABC transporter ATP-binding protein [Campylobacter sp. CS_NA1]MDA3085549.1 ABC transporter ATP-binding protein [Campylobacter sp. CS_ED1]MDA3090403.1 ABC transporter ATP-binding protein [Campylobacter sp. CS_ED2]WBR50815.1 ABC transporter ATP-binding protein [Campylobacter sp. CS_NA3]
MELLKGVNLTHAYDYTLFENINLSIHEKESIAVLGVSGCGKSTLLHILCTLLKPNSGEVYFNEKEIYSLKDDEKIKIRRNDFGIIFQSHYLFKGFSAYENIELAAKLTKQEIDEKILQKLKIESVVKQSVGDLSGGQQQRISIARVLSKKPKIIFADEPTGNLDKDTANDVMSVIFDYIQEASGALVLVTHDENLAKKCSTVYRLNEKKLEKIS